MWEALMVLRLIASIGPGFMRGSQAAGMREAPPTLPADALKGAIRLSFATWRLSLPLPQRDDHESHDRKIA